QRVEPLERSALDVHVVAALPGEVVVYAHGAAWRRFPDHGAASTGTSTPTMVSSASQPTRACSEPSDWRASRMRRAPLPAVMMFSTRARSADSPIVSAT